MIVLYEVGTSIHELGLYVPGAKSESNLAAFTVAIREVFQDPSSCISTATTTTTSLAYEYLCPDPSFVRAVGP